MSAHIIYKRSKDSLYDEHVTVVHAERLFATFQRARTNDLFYQITVVGSNNSANPVTLDWSNSFLGNRRLQAVESSWSVETRSYNGSLFTGLCIGESICFMCDIIVQILTISNNQSRMVVSLALWCNCEVDYVVEWLTSTDNSGRVIVLYQKLCTCKQMGFGHSVGSASLSVCR